MVAFRDLKVSMDIAKMAELGKFEQEFIVYGCCYLENDARHYYVSNRYENVSRFQAEALVRGVYTSPVVEWLDRVPVPSGMENEYANLAKWHLAEHLRAQFSLAFLQRFQRLADSTANDSAEPLLRNLQKSLYACFDRQILALAQGIAATAFAQKKITKEFYFSFRAWIDEHFRQMADDTVVKKEVKRTFYGFGCEQSPGHIKYYCNAYASEIYKRRDTLLKQQKFCTPVMSESYYYDQMPQMAAERARFLTALAEWMDDEYWSLLQGVRDCPCAIRESALAALASDSPLEEEWLAYYCGLWQVR